MGHRLGQVFLKDANICRKIIEAAALSDADFVLEIGCGAGDLTVFLQEKTKQMSVVELDPVCIEKTKDRLPDASIQFFHQDVLDFDFGLVPSPMTVVANIPYYISAKIIKRLIDHRSQIKRAIIMVQKEFADKLVAPPGDHLYTSLSVYTSFFYEVRFLFKVSKTCFLPVPKVDSAVIELVPKVEVPSFEDESFFNMVRSVFWGRRKPLASALSKTPYLKLDPAFKDTPFVREHGKRRGEMLSLAEFLVLYQDIAKFIFV